MEPEQLKKRILETLQAQRGVLQDKLFALRHHFRARQFIFVALQSEIGPLEQDCIQHTGECEPGEQCVDGAEHVAENAAACAGIEIDKHS